MSISLENWSGLDELARTDEDWVCLEKIHTNWYDAYQSVCPWAATKSELVELAKTAPNGFSRGVIYSWLAARQDVANQTGLVFT